MIARRLCGVGRYAFDQMYVNFYDASARANIEFHHDNHSCTCGFHTLVPECGSVRILFVTL